MSCNSATRELLTFWIAGTLGPAEAALVAGHVDTCAECRADAVAGIAIVKGFQSLHLRADEIVSAAAGELHSPHLLVCSTCREEVALLRSVNSDLGGSVQAVGVRGWRLALTAAAVLVIAVPLIWQVRQPSSTPTPSPGAATPDPAPPASLPLKIMVEKASLDALANETVSLRGEPTPRRALLSDLAAALEPYRRDDFAESASRLTRLRGTRPNAPEIAYYLGVCLLLLDRPADAIEPLEQASRQFPSAETDYYLAVARVNTGQVDAGVAALTRLCDGRQEVSERSCVALSQVRRAR